MSVCHGYFLSRLVVHADDSESSAHVQQSNSVAMMSMAGMILDPGVNILLSSMVYSNAS